MIHEEDLVWGFPYPQVGRWALVLLFFALPILVITSIVNINWFSFAVPVGVCCLPVFMIWALPTAYFAFVWNKKTKARLREIYDGLSAIEKQRAFLQPNVRLGMNRMADWSLSFEKSFNPVWVYRIVVLYPDRIKVYNVGQFLFNWFKPEATIRKEDIKTIVFQDLLAAKGCYFTFYDPERKKNDESLNIYALAGEWSNFEKLVREYYGKAVKNA